MATVVKKKRYQTDGTSCAAPGCKNTFYSGASVSFFRFPSLKDPKR